MSALGHERTFGGALLHVRFTPVKQNLRAGRLRVGEAAGFIDANWYVIRAVASAALERDVLSREGILAAPLDAARP